MSRDDERALGQLIRDRSGEIEQRWLERVTRDLADRPAVHPTQLRDGIPDYLAELARLLLQPAGPNVTEGWVRIARAHGITRVRVGFDIEQLVREFAILRKAIEESALAARVLTTASMSRLADVIEAAVMKSVSAYVERRDFEARGRQAENIGLLIHELRNPLAVAVTATELLRQRVPSEEKAVATLERVHRRLEQLVDGVLLTEKLESGKVEPRYRDVGVRELVAAGTDAARAAAAKKGLAFEIHGDDDFIVTIDPDLTRSALQNLADNAVKYTDVGRVDIDIERDQVMWTVHVRDTCPGLSPAELHTIFEPFRRGTTTKQGTGLGLAIARRALETQGGMLGADSPGDDGCHFWFRLPLRPTDA
jgi:signal transduction histidine kinase